MVKRTAHAPWGEAHSPGATPLDPDEAVGLMPKHINTQQDLNEWEQTNILQGMQWAQRQMRRDVLDEAFLRELHRRMFGHTWTWAGAYRKSDKNIGADWRHIPVRLRDLLEDTKAQISFNTYAADEIAVRLHHRLVWIHPFANGNGRHARLAADLLVQRLGQAPFSWGGDQEGGDNGQGLVEASERRSQYLSALRKADAGDCGALLAFARSQ